MDNDFDVDNVIFAGFVEMSYDKERDILKMYKWKCGYTKNEGDQPCRIKFLDKPSLILHLKIVHGITGIRDVSLPKSELNTAIKFIQIPRLRRGICS